MKNLTLFFFCAILFLASCKKDSSPTGNNNNTTLNAPSELTAYFLSDTVVILNWKDNSENETQFDIEKSSDSAQYVLVKTVGNNTTTALVQGIYQVDTPYYFRVRAIAGSRTSPYSNTAKVKRTSSAPSNPVVHILSPGNNASIIDTATITVSATDDLGVVKVEIYIDNQLDSSRIFIVPPYRWYWNVAQLPDGSLHTIYARAYDGDGNSSSTQVLTVTTHYADAAPSNVQVTALTETTAVVQWHDNSSFETGFEIEKSINDTTAFSFAATVGANVTTATVSGAYDSVSTYYFRVRARAGVNSTAYSNNSYATRYYLVIQQEIDLVNVQGGTFAMGSPLGVGNNEEHPQHYVTLSNFSIGKYEVTQALWKHVVVWKQRQGGTTLNPTPSYFTGDSLRPVEQVSWNDIQVWLGYLNELFGTTTYRLPTEAEWEYAARGGTHWNDNFTYSGSNNIDSVAWYWNNSGSLTHQRGTKAANQLGIYDMSGNVWEWCNDWYDVNYYSQSQSSTNPQGPTSGSSRVLRGGSWLMWPYNVRCAGRSGGLPSGRSYEIGFRYARTN
jgi:formylglycine-generating enzyme required for sulfatase activity